MIGSMFKLGEQKTRPGVYVRWYNDGGTPTIGGTTGIAAAVVKSDWGKVGGVTTVSDAGKIDETIGTGSGAEVVKQILRGGAVEVLAVRVGDGGNEASVTLEDEDGADSLKVISKYPTSRDFNVTIRKSLNDEEKEFIAYEGTRVIERLSFAKGSSEMEELKDLINETSVYFTASEQDGNGTIEEVVNESFSGGDDPDTSAEDYTKAFELLDRKFFDGLAVDTEDVSIHASLDAYVNRSLKEGSRIIGVVGEKTSEPFKTRLDNAKAFNNFAVTYVGNGFVDGEEEVEGALAAARVLGEMVSRDYKDSLTKKELSGTSGIVGQLTPSEYTEAAKNGMMVFSESVNGFAQVDYGINTLVSVDSDEDEGWKKIRRVRTRFELIDRIAFTIANAMSSGVDNNDDGRQYIITLANGIIGQMVTDGGLESGEMIIDESNPPEGDSVWFKFEDLVDLDGIEKVYLAFGFRY